MGKSALLVETTTVDDPKSFKDLYSLREDLVRLSNSYETIIVRAVYDELLRNKKGGVEGSCY